MKETLRPGYKQTEVGVIPEDWDTKKLGELALFRTGPFGSALHKADYTNDGVPIVNPMHIIDGQIVPTRTMTVTESAATKLSEFRLAPGEVIIGRRGDMGRCAVVQHEHTGWLCGTGSMIIRTSSNVDTGFLQRVLSSPAIILKIEGASVGSTMINLNQGTLSQLVIQAPPLREQRAIAAALLDVDVLLAKLDQLIAKKRDLKQAAMQQLLTGQTRLPGFSGTWEVKRLGEIADVSKGSQLHGDGTNAAGDVPHYNGGISPSSYTEKGNAPADTIAISEGGNSCGYVQFISQPFWCGGHCYSVTPKGIEKLFLYHALKARQPAIMGLRVGSGLPNVQKTALKAFSFESPRMEAEQTAIAAVLSDMDAEIAALQARRDKTRALKQGMMQELLTGRIRLV